MITEATITLSQDSIIIVLKKTMRTQLEQVELHSIFKVLQFEYIMSLYLL